MKLSLVLLYFTSSFVLSVFSLSLNPSEDEEWNAFKRKYGKNYPTREEDQLRKNTYFENKLKITEHNDLYNRNSVTNKLGINKFADMTTTEFRLLTSCYKGDQQETKNHELYVAPANEELPKTVNWTQKGAVTPVKDQLRCGSCYAFSATGAIEGQHFLKTSKLVSLSEQNLVDCSREEGNNGCHGGDMNSSFEYVKKNNGIDTEESYPYIGKENSKCLFNSSTVGATVTGFKQVPSGNESALQSAVANVGPISVAIDADHDSFYFHISGIFYEKNCSSSEEHLDHGVLVVGYGSENGQDYWLVKNSWSVHWGEQGYIKMSRNRDNNCGIATAAVYPLV